MRCSSRIAVCGWILAVTYGGNALPAEPPARVGDFGGYQRISVVGSESFTAENIRWTLACDFDVALAAHPLAPLVDYLATLERRCRDGYWEHGFPQATALAKFDERSGKIVLTIDEGPQLLAGDIQISGASRIDVVGLREHLLTVGDPRRALPAAASDSTSDDEKDQAPLWRRGQPANFSALAFQRREQAIQAALAGAGFHQCVFDAQLIQNVDALRADLQIKLLDEGAPAFAKEIVVTGLERNSREALLREIEWRDDRLVTSAELDRIEQRLYQSGRFIRHSVRLAPPDAEQGRYRLLVDVLEYPRVTPLGRPLTAVEEVLWKHAAWFNDWQQRDVDLVADHTYAGNRYQMILSPRRGVLLQRRGAADAAPATTLVFAADHTACYPAGGEWKFIMPNLSGEISLSAHFILNEDSDRDTHPFGFKFACLFTREVEEGRSPSNIQFDASPAQCMAVAYEHNAKCSLAEGVLTVDTEMALRKFDVASGQLLQYTAKGEDLSAGSEISFVQGAFTQELHDVRKAAERQTNAYDAKHPLRSTARFVLSEPVLREMLTIAGKELPHEKPILEPPLRSALEKIVNSSAFDALDEPGPKQPADETRRFSLASAPVPNDDWFKQFVRATLPGTDIFFPRESWPATLWRESIHYVIGQPAYYRHELGRLYAAPDTGPLCSLAIASLVGKDIGQAFARQGLTRLSVADFRNDYEPLLDEQTLVGIAARGLLDSMRSFDDDERAALGRLLVGEHALEFVAATRLVRENRDRPAADLLPPVLDHWWELGLRAKVEAALRKISP